jgi:hypothetical protein
MRRREDQGLYDMQPPCRQYQASEPVAFAALDVDEMVRVFFRKVPPDIENGSESFRVVEVFSADSEIGAAVVLKDIELYLPEGATILQ